VTEQLNAERDALIERYAALGMTAQADALRQGAPMRAPLVRAPMIIDTDVGGDPDDAVAVLAAAALVPELRLVVTSDEYGGRRARFARHLLDLAGRPEVAVAAGREVSARTPYYHVDGLIPDAVADQPTDVVAAVAAVCAEATGTVRWVGMGPMSNLADVLAVRPDLVERLALTQMGGALDYRDPERAQHNFRLDVDAARAVLAVLPRPRLVTSDVTFRPETALTRESPEYGLLVRAGAPAWAPVLVSHLERWYADAHPASMQHDALTLSVAMQLPFVHSDLLDVVIDEKGRTSLDGDGLSVRCFMSRRADYPAFRRWLERALS
jgi:pyrimidine-specific ribonucleoside hydrolase